jgi:uncharacterized protein YacL
VDGRLGVAVVPADSEVDLKAVSDALGGRKASIALPAEAEKATGYVLGGISPLGTRRPLPTVVDASATGWPTIHVSAGRRGLEILGRMRKGELTPVQVIDEDVPGTPEVDSKLVALARKNGRAILTNDLNLNRIADLQGVRVLNVNSLANAVKPALLPGEDLRVRVIQPGKDAGQGVGYLDDGTMVVCEDGGSMISKETDVVVKSVLQSSAGRMIFGRLPTNADR